MEIRRIYNNNIILTRDDKNVENILMGKGIAFNKNIGEKVDEKLIEKKFVLGHDKQVQNFIELMNRIPGRYLELSTRIISMAEKELNTSFRDDIYIALTDHINFAIEKVKRNIPTQNLLLWEIKRFYTKEYEAAKHSLKLIEKYEQIRLPDDEAGYLAIHFVNAQYVDDKSSNDGIEMAQMINKIVKIVEFHFSIVLKEDSLNFERFVTHIRYFSKRVFSRQLLESKDNEYYIHLKRKYPEIVQCVDKIDRYIEKEYDCRLTDEEYTYFIVHIGRVISR